MADDPHLEQELAELLDREWFAPPQAFVDDALIQDLSVHEAAERDPAGWWAEQARALDWSTEPTQSLDESDAPFYRWFADGKINASYNCLDRHVAAGLGDRVAFHWHGEEGEHRELTYAWLLAETQKLASALKGRGVLSGDVVGIYLPMIPEVIVAMLACARIGAPHNVVFGGFSAESVGERMAFSHAKALITVDGARRKGKTAPVKADVDTVLDPDSTIATIVVVRHTGIDCPMTAGRDLYYDEVLAAADPVCPPEELDAEHPLFILYSSGSTAKPKGILHTTGGYLTGVAWSFRNVFDVKPEKDVFFCTADVGWITGHSYMIYGPLANAATSVMYEGAPDYPAKDVWWRICAERGVTIFYTAPTAIRTCIKWGVDEVLRHDLSKLRLIGTVGEPINPRAWVWYWRIVGGGRCPVVDTWWQTETGQIMITTLPGAQPAKPGAAGTPLPGIVATVVDSDGEEVPRGTQGLLTLRRPWPGMLRTLYQERERYVSGYWERFGPPVYFVGDASLQDDNDYVWVIGRVDDVINVSGHRMSTAEVESAIVSHPKVAEAAVIGQADEQSGQAICAFVTVRGDIATDDALELELREHVAQRIGKLARPRRIIWADDLPKTRSGKIMRRLLRDVAEGHALGDVTTLRDPAVMAVLQDKIATSGDEE